MHQCPQLVVWTQHLVEVRHGVLLHDSEVSSMAREQAEVEHQLLARPAVQGQHELRSISKVSEEVALLVDHGIARVEGEPKGHRLVLGLIVDEAVELEKIGRRHLAVINVHLRSRAVGLLRHNQQVAVLRQLLQRLLCSLVWPMVEDVCQKGNGQALMGNECGAGGDHAHGPLPAGQREHRSPVNVKSSLGHRAGQNFHSRRNTLSPELCSLVLQPLGPLVELRSNQQLHCALIKVNWIVELLRQHVQPGTVVKQLGHCSVVENEERKHMRLCVGAVAHFVHAFEAPDQRRPCVNCALRLAVLRNVFLKELHQSTPVDH
mmetsp:Transcript_2474/g.8812  ORF Transcript_2474/g.8812 Transcript_2474/m.8812 type:complete len:319 (-) Transcript_2474:285-1241(-)